MIYQCLYFCKQFSRNLFISFSEIVRSDSRYQEVVKKKKQNWIFQKKKFYYNGWKSPKCWKYGAFFNFHKILSLLFPGNNLKWKTLQFSVCCVNAISGKILLLKFHAKKLRSNQIAGLFDDEYLWKRCMDILDFFAWLYSPSQGSIWGYWFWLYVSRHAKPHPKVRLSSLGRNPRLNSIQNVRLA